MELKYTCIKLELNHNAWLVFEILQDTYTTSSNGNCHLFILDDEIKLAYQVAENINVDYSLYDISTNFNLPIIYSDKISNTSYLENNGYECK